MLAFVFVYMPVCSALCMCVRVCCGGLYVLNLMVTEAVRAAEPRETSQAESPFIIHQHKRKLEI